MILRGPGLPCCGDVTPISPHSRQRQVRRTLPPPPFLLPRFFLFALGDVWPPRTAAAFDPSTPSAFRFAFLSLRVRPLRQIRTLLRRARSQLRADEYRLATSSSFVAVVVAGTLSSLHGPNSLLHDARATQRSSASAWRPEVLGSNPGACAGPLRQVRGRRFFTTARRGDVPLAEPKFERREPRAGSREVRTGGSASARELPPRGDDPPRAPEHLHHDLPRQASERLRRRGEGEMRPDRPEVGTSGKVGTLGALRVRPRRIVTTAVGFLAPRVARR